MHKLLVVSILMLLLLPSIHAEAITNDEELHMLIITTEDFCEELSDFISHKNSYGIATTILCIEDISSSQAGRDIQEQIKYAIKDVYDSLGIDFVLLLGDISLVPIRTTATQWEYNGALAIEDVPTDLYYADLYDSNGSFQSWDTNDDDVFAQTLMRANLDDFEVIAEDTMDLRPDVGVGRIPCKNSKELKTVLSKIITYETQTYGSEWFNRLLLLAGDTFPGVGGINEGEVVTQSVINSLSDFEPTKLWTSLHSFNALRINLEISKGAGFVSYSGHGFQYGFGTSDPDSSSIRFYYTPYKIGMLNFDKLPIFYLDACWTGILDYNILSLPTPGFAWSLVKKTHGGAVACIASTRVGMGGFVGDPFAGGSPSLHQKFFQAYEPGIHLSEMLMSAQNTYIDTHHPDFPDYFTVQEFILIGDPSLKVGGYP